MQVGDGDQSDLAYRVMGEDNGNIQRWGSILINELNNRDTVIESTPASNIYRVVTVTSIGRPRKGDIAYSASTGKFKGYVSLGSETSWQDLN